MSYFTGKEEIDKLLQTINPDTSEEITIDLEGNNLETLSKEAEELGVGLSDYLSAVLIKMWDSGALQKYWKKSDELDQKRA